MNNPEQAILAVWQASAAPWVQAVRGQGIASRIAVTDAAIVQAVCAAGPASVLDIGCGEGWLARALAARGMAVTGVDAVPALVAAARQASGGRFLPMAYADLAAGALTERFDALVCNFSLLGEDSTERLLAALPARLNPGGRLFVQTLHPQAAGEPCTADGWREGSWAGIDGDFGAAAPWYFRTQESWLALFARCGWSAVETHAPAWPDGRPAALLFVARPG